jgi:hypothetical protein
MNYTLDIEMQFNNFTTQMRRKEHMDDVFVLGKGMVHYLNEFNSGDLKSGQTGSLLSRFIDAHVKDKVQGLSDEDKDFSFLSRPIQIRAFKKDPSRIDGRYSRYNFSTRKFIQYIKRSASSAIMFVSPISGFVNAMQAYTASVRMGAAYSVAKNLDDKFSLFGTDGIKDIHDFGAGDYHKGLKFGMDILTKPLRGENLNEDKL